MNAETARLACKNYLQDNQYYRYVKEQIAKYAGKGLFELDFPLSWFDQLTLASIKNQLSIEGYQTSLDDETMTVNWASKSRTQKKRRRES